MPYLFLALAFLCNAAANVLLKLAALHGFTFSQTLHGVLNTSTAYAASAIVLFGLNLCFYLVALERIPLSIGYPVMVGMTFFITILASVLLGERINLLHALGMTLIIAGIFLTVHAGLNYN